MRTVTKDVDEKSVELFYLYLAVLILQISFIVMQFVPIFDVKVLICI